MVLREALSLQEGKIIEENESNDSKPSDNSESRKKVKKIGVLFPFLRTKYFLVKFVILIKMRGRVSANAFSEAKYILKVHLGPSLSSVAIATDIFPRGPTAVTR